MPSREELESHPVTTLKKEISKTNIKGYSKMKKPEIVELMLKNKSRFHHIKMAEKKPKKGTHKMPDGTTMSGTVHTKDSKPVEKPKEKPKKKKLVIKEKPVEKPKPKENTYDEKPVIKKQQELLKLLEDNKDKLKKIDTFRVTSRGKVRDGNFYDETKLKMYTKAYGTPSEAVKRLNYHINKVKEELAKPVEKPVEKKQQEKANNTIKKELEKIVNNDFGRRLKYETQVLNGKLVDDSKEYQEKEEDANDQYEDDLMEFFKKNKLNRRYKSKHFISDSGFNMKFRNLLKTDSISLKTLSNYIKIGKLNKQIEDKQKAKPKPKPVEKPKEKPKAKSNKEIANDLDDTFFKMDLEEALKELKNVNKKDTQSVTNKIRKWNSFVGSLKNKIKKSKDLNLKKLMESVVSAHNELNSKPKPKAQISEVDFMEKSYLNDIEKEVKKSKYKDRLDMNTLIEAAENMEKSQRLRAFEIIKKIRKTINTKEVNNLYPLEVIKKRLKL